MPIEHDLQEVIRKNLPGLLAGELVDRLVEGEKAIAILVKNDVELVRIRSEVESLRAQVRKQHDLKAEAAQVAEDKASVLTRENALNVTLANERADGAKATLAAVLDLTRTVFRNPTFVETTMKSVSHMNPTGYTTTASDSETTRRTVE